MVRNTADAATALFVAHVAKKQGIKIPLQPGRSLLERIERRKF
jgi:hypothetical protein